MSWYHIYIGEPHTSFSRSGEFNEAMNALGLARGNSGAAIYVFHDHQTGGDHYYFTPGAKAAALTFAASSCNRPARQALGVFFAGDSKLLFSLYP